MSIYPRLRQPSTQNGIAFQADPTTEFGPTTELDPTTEFGPTMAFSPKRRGKPRVRRVVAWMITVLAGLLVFLALIAPNQLPELTPGAFARLPVEGLIGLGLLLVLPGRARTVVAVLAGVLLGLLSIIKILDLGFYATLSRPFDPALDWTFVKDGVAFLTTSIGRIATIGAVIAIVALIVALPVLMTLSIRRLTRLMLRHRRPAGGVLLALGAAWVACALLGTQIVPGDPVAAHSAAALTYDNVLQVRAGLRDPKTFAAQIAVDPFRDTPNNQLLTGLRGKDVILAFVESYGVSAIQDPKLAPPVDAALAAGDQELKAAGYSSRSAYLTSPTYGGGSWLAHSTLLSGLWINNQQRYNTLVKTQRLTLTSAFKRADWRTVAVVPDVTRAWPEGAFYGYNKVYAQHDLGYQGPNFGWAVMPDQFALSAFQKAERAAPHPPLMTEMALVSSHAPWAPIPSLVDWNKLGDGSIFTPMKAAEDTATVVWHNPDRVRSQYAQSIAYSLTSLITYVQKYGGKNLVLIFLGDHQAAPIISGNKASHNVPITIVAHDPAVLDRISSWGWSTGLKPAATAPVWPMSAFRNQFLTAFGSKPKP